MPDIDMELTCGKYPEDLVTIFNETLDGFTRDIDNERWFSLKRPLLCPRIIPGVYYYVQIDNGEDTNGIDEFTTIFAEVDDYGVPYLKLDGRTKSFVIYSISPEYAANAFGYTMFMSSDTSANSTSHKVVIKVAKFGDPIYQYENAYLTAPGWDMCEENDKLYLEDGQRYLCLFGEQAVVGKAFKYTIYGSDEVIFLGNPTALDRLIGQEGDLSTPNTGDEWFLYQMAEEGSSYGMQYGSELLWSEAKGLTIYKLHDTISNCDSYQDDGSIIVHDLVFYGPAYSAPSSPVAPKFLAEWFMYLDDMGSASDLYFVELVEGKTYTVNVSDMTYTGVAKKATYTDSGFEFVYVGTAGLGPQNDAEWEPDMPDFCLTYVPEYLQTPGDTSTAVSINELYVVGMASEEVTVAVYEEKVSSDTDDPAVPDPEPAPDADYTFTVELIDGFTPTADFPLIRAKDVLMPDGTRLSDLENEPPSYELMGKSTRLEPEKYYVFGEVSSLDLTLILPADGRVHEHCFEFQPSDSFTSLTITPEPVWATTPQFIPGKTCQVSIMRGIGVIVCA